MRDRTILENLGNADGIDRRGFLKCMAWAGTGALWVISGGIARSYGLSKIIGADPLGHRDALLASGDFSFVQISDSHIGFAKDANPDVVGTLQACIAKINALHGMPSFVIHTGDLTHMSKPNEFDTLNQVLQGASTDKVFFVPGEHDVIGDNGKQFLDRFGKGTQGDGWYSFDASGVHFIGLVNVLNLRAGGLGLLGADQLEWLERDVRGLSSSTPIVVFAHIPLWSVYPDWGWGTDDATQALTYLKRFGSVTVLNGHIHQTLQKIEGNITFHTAMSTAFPQPPPRGAPSPGPMKVPAERLRTLLGLTAVNYVEGNHSLALVQSTLAGGSSGENRMDDQESGRRTSTVRQGDVDIVNFRFSPRMLTVPAGTKVTWTNRDDVPHTVTSVNKTFSSPMLDTEESYSKVFNEPGTFDYFCAMHPKMTGTVLVVAHEAGASGQ